MNESGENRGPFRILIADDHSDTTMVLQDVLEDEGYEVRSAADGMEVLKLFPDFQPDILILDLNMPKLDGFDVCSTLRSRPDAEGVRMLALSGLMAPRHRRRALSLGFDAHMKKPLRLVELRTVISSLLKGQQSD